MSPKTKKDFITEETRFKYYDFFNEPSNLNLFDNKIETYKIFEKYYKRHVNVYTNKEENFHKNFKPNLTIVKPTNLSGGKGVRLLTEDDNHINLLKKYNGSYNLEDRLFNTDEIMRIHSSSLNTVRVVTLRLDDRAEAAFGFCRFWVNDSVVDNAHAGGIICVLDVKTGIITEYADKYGNVYEKHPNSHIKLVGYKLPEYDNLLKLVKEMAMIIPKNRYTGWDMAFTKKLGIN